MEIYYDILNISLKPLNGLGLGPTAKLNKSVASFTIFTIFVLSILVPLQFVYYENNLRLYADVLEAILLLLHAFSKAVTLIWKQDEARQLVEMVAKFWPYYDANKKLQEENLFMLSIVKKVLKFFLYFSLNTLLARNLLIIFSHILPIVAYIPEFIPFWMFAIFDSLCLSIYAAVAICFDILMAGLVLMAYVQFRILNSRIALMKYAKITDDFTKISECKANLRIVIEHHTFLLRFINALNGFLTYTLLVQFFITTCSACFELIIISKNSISHIGEIVQSVTFLASIFLELLLVYGFPADLVTSEASKTVWAVYNSDWVDCNDISIRKELIIIMQRAQKPELVSAGGLIDATLENCSKIIKLAFSLFTFVKSL